MNSEPLPMNMKVESSKDINMHGANLILGDFLHKGAAIHSANNTISGQLHGLHQGLREERKLQQHYRDTKSTDS
jgi:hypothetical protein